MWRCIRVFTLFVISVFVLSFYTAKNNMGVSQRVIATAVVALVATLLVMFDGRKTVKRKRRSYPDRVFCIYLVSDPHVFYRIENEKIYMGMDTMPIYEIRGNMIYPWMFPEPVLRIEKNAIYRGMEQEPLLEIRGNLIYHKHSDKVVYEIRPLW